MLLSYYKKSLTDLLAKVQDLQVDPLEKADQCLEIQETLVGKIRYVEKKIWQHKRFIKEAKKELAASRLEKDSAVTVREKTERSQLIVNEYQELVFILKSIGDALAFIYLPRWDVKPMSFKQGSGFLSGKDGFKRERKIMRALFRVGAVAILNDLTNNLRYGDITVIKGGTFQVLEVKSGSHPNRRAKRQLERLAKVAEYLSTDVVSGLYGDEVEMRRLAVHSQERDHLAELNQLIGIASRTGFGFLEIERGLHYGVEVLSTGTPRLLSAMRGLKHKQIVFLLNVQKYEPRGYSPLTLSVRDPDALFGFYSGKLMILVLIDCEVMAVKLASHGLKLEFEESGEWAFTVRHVDGGSDERPDYMSVSRHFLGG